MKILSKILNKLHFISNKKQANLINVVASVGSVY